MLQSALAGVKCTLHWVVKEELCEAKITKLKEINAEKLTMR